MINTSYIKYQDHFKLHVLFKDIIVFESELDKNNISFYKETVQVGSTTAYFLEDKDRIAINKLLIENGIVASTDIISLTDYTDAKKANRIYFYVACAVILMILLLTVAS